MTTVDFVISLFCWVDDRLGPRPKHPQAKLWPSELITVGLLFALKGSSFRSFYRWLDRDRALLFASSPSARGSCAPSARTKTKLAPSWPTRPSSP